MKKLSVVFAALAVMMAVVFTGCDIFAEETSGQWYKYSGGSTLTAEDADTTNSTTVDFANVYVQYYSNVGLTIILEQEASSTTYTKPVYAKHNYTADEFGSGKWTALLGSGKFKESSTPPCVSNSSAYIDVSSASEILKGGVNWKKVLANQLLNYLE